ncbi:MAG TPA: DoxX family protein [Streptosporangiaceae bacterium]|nr:DoxX family protein [Streptosporangiaceae bacterium]
MSVALWIVAGLLAAMFAAAGLAKLTQPKAKLRERMKWVDSYPDFAVKTIGALELLAAIGLILPGALGIAPVLVPLAAVGLAALMIGAAITHARRKETREIAVNVVLLLLAAFVAWGRFGPCKFK